MAITLKPALEQPRTGGQSETSGGGQREARADHYFSPILEPGVHERNPDS